MENRELEESQTRYVMGLSFSEDLSRVVLIKKDRPGRPWHGFLMGLGGRVEAEDYRLPTSTREARALASQNAMIREFSEESGICVLDWNWYCSLQGLNIGLDRDGRQDQPFRVDCYWNRGPAWRLVRSNEKELVKSYPINYLDRDDNPKLFPNMTWLLPMALTLASGKEHRAKNFGFITEGR